MPRGLVGEFVQKFVANGLSDALYSQDNDPNAQVGGCIFLQNVVPDRHTRGVYAPRPAIATLFTIVGCPHPVGLSVYGYPSCIYTLGSKVYGLVLATDGTNFYDMPFIYDTVAAAFTTVVSMTASNIPITQAGYPNGAAGSVVTDWTPPVMQLVGSKIVVCHIGFQAPNYFATLDVGTNTWSAGNLTGALSFTVPPVSVTQFNGRAYYAVGGAATSNNVIFSDSLNPVNCTNASQVLTIGDNQPVVGFGQQPYTSSTVGGIIQSILAFKANSIAQITGDPTTNNLAVNVIASGVGSKAPQTIASTPLGCMFMAADGVRYVNNYGQVSNPLPGVRNPFLNCNTLASLCFPSTACAAYNANMYRISLYTTDLIGNVYRQEYVYDLEYGWHGPHVYGAPSSYFCISLIVPFQASFAIVERSTNLTTATGASIQEVDTSSLSPGPLDSFVESSTTLLWNVLSCALADEYPMLAKTLEESTFAYNPGNTSGSVTLSVLPTPVSTTPASPPNPVPGLSQVLSYTPGGSLWGSVTWGPFTWGGSGQTVMDETTISWTDVTAYKNLQWQITGTAALNQRIGPISSRGTIRGFTNLDVP